VARTRELFAEGPDRFCDRVGSRSPIRDAPSPGSAARASSTGSKPSGTTCFRRRPHHGVVAKAGPCLARPALAAGPPREAVSARLTRKSWEQASPTPSGFCPLRSGARSMRFYSFCRVVDDCVDEPGGEGEAGLKAAGPRKSCAAMPASRRTELGRELAEAVVSSFSDSPIVLRGHRPPAVAWT